MHIVGLQSICKCSIARCEDVLQAKGALAALFVEHPLPSVLDPRAAMALRGWSLTVLGLVLYSALVN